MEMESSLRIVAYSLYLNIEFRLPHRNVADKLNQLFGFHLVSDTSACSRQRSQQYRRNYKSPDKERV